MWRREKATSASRSACSGMLPAKLGWQAFRKRCSSREGCTGKAQVIDMCSHESVNLEYICLHVACICVQQYGLHPGVVAERCNSIWMSLQRCCCKLGILIAEVLLHRSDSTFEWAFGSKRPDCYHGRMPPCGHVQSCKCLCTDHLIYVLARIDIALFVLSSAK